MKVVLQTKKSLQVELTPFEVELLRGALSKELSHRRRVLDKSKPATPEELMYHTMTKKDTEDMVHAVNSSIKKYKDWGVLH